MKTPVSSVTLLVLGCVCAEAVLAASGTTGTEIKTQFETILTYAKAAAGVIATLAFLWAGFRMIFSENVTLRQVAPAIVGGIVIGSAPWLAELFITY